VFVWIRLLDNSFLKHIPSITFLHKLVQKEEELGPAADHSGPAPYELEDEEQQEEVGSRHDVP